MDQSIFKQTESQEEFLLEGKLIKYIIGTEPFGHGSFGVVWRGQTGSLDNGNLTDLAVKKLNNISSNEKELRMHLDQLMAGKLEKVLKLKHDNLILYWAAYVRPTTPGVIAHIVMIMEYANGGNLDSYIKSKDEALDSNEVFTFSKQILSGLEHLHSNNLIHSDLKPANILISVKGECKVLKIGDLDDFIPMKGSNTLSTDVIKGKGTPRYFSPEMARKYLVNLDCMSAKDDILKQVGRKTDIWSFGCILIDMIRGRQPPKFEHIFSGSELEINHEQMSHIKIIEFIHSGGIPVPNINEINADIWGMIATCLQWNPNYRPLAKKLLQWTALRLSTNLQRPCDVLRTPPHQEEEVLHENILNDLVDQLRPLKEVNILVLGETGVGKSTWINAFANYLAYPSLQEAEASDIISLIATSFTMTVENYEEKLVTTGSETNEDQVTGQSATQSPKSYMFFGKESVLRLIDTPGIGDTRGIEQDKKSFQKIMSHLSYFDEIHGICILLKPNNARLSVMFSFCIKELLANLHRDASRNIVFCFTNSRGTFYRPGDTLPALRKLLDENMEVKIPLSKDTMYCLDNESFRFLAAVENGIKFSDDERNNYATSWKMSTVETKRLLEHVVSLKPHAVKNTLSLNNARRMIVELTKPLADITQSIAINIAVLKDREQEVKQLGHVTADLKDKLYVPVCTAAKCIQDDNILSQIATKEENIRHVEKHIKTLQDRVKQLEDERCIIAKVSSKFAHFLKHNAIAPYDDALESYLDQLIYLEGSKVHVGGNNKALDDLKSMKKLYKEEKDILDKAMSENDTGLTSLVSPADIQSLVEKLYQLPLNGESLKKSVQLAGTASAKQFQYQEIAWRPPKWKKEKKNPFWTFFGF